MIRYLALDTLGGAINSSGLTRQEIEKRTGVSGGYVTKAVQRDRTISEQFANAIAATIGVQLEDVFELTPDSRLLLDAFSRNERLTLTGEHARFWAKVQITDGCWLWLGSKDEHGRGRINVNKRPVHAARYSYELAHGPIPKGVCVCHRCDNPPCVNPAHLFLGTHLENVADMYAKKRHATGEKLGKLTAQQVLAIRSRYSAGGETYLGLAREFGVTDMAVAKIVKRISWKHL